MNFKLTILSLGLVILGCRHTNHVNQVSMHKDQLIAPTLKGGNAIVPRGSDISKLSYSSGTSSSMTGESYTLDFTTHTLSAEWSKILPGPGEKRGRARSQLTLSSSEVDAVKAQLLAMKAENPPVDICKPSPKAIDNRSRSLISISYGSSTNNQTAVKIAAVTGGECVNGYVKNELFMEAVYDLEQKLSPPQDDRDYSPS